MIHGKCILCQYPYEMGLSTHAGSYRATVHQDHFAFDVFDSDGALAVTARRTAEKRLLRDPDLLMAATSEPPVQWTLRGQWWMKLKVVAEDRSALISYAAKDKDIASLGIRLELREKELRVIRLADSVLNLSPLMLAGLAYFIWIRHHKACYEN
jgi:hypothetical protein